MWPCCQPLHIETKSLIASTQLWGKCGKFENAFKQNTEHQLTSLTSDLFLKAYTMGVIFNYHHVCFRCGTLTFEMCSNIPELLVASQTRVILKELFITYTRYLIEP